MLTDMLKELAQAIAKSDMAGRNKILRGLQRVGMDEATALDLAKLFTTTVTE